MGAFQQTAAIMSAKTSVTLIKIRYFAKRKVLT